MTASGVLQQQVPSGAHLAAFVRGAVCPADDRIRRGAGTEPAIASATRRSRAPGIPDQRSATRLSEYRCRPPRFKTSGMAREFVGCQRGQMLLMPPSLVEWLPEDHLVWTVLGAVDAMDLDRFAEAYRLGAAGRAPYDPAMMVALLYAYARGIRAPREGPGRCRPGPCLPGWCVCQAAAGTGSSVGSVWCSSFGSQCSQLGRYQFQSAEELHARGE